MKFDSIWAEKYILNELSFYNINVIEWSDSDSGLAWCSERLVKIPKPTTQNRFMICLHEIFHIARFSAHKRLKVYEYEFDCEMWTIFKAKTLGLKTKEYEQGAKGYVAYCLSRAYNRGLDLKKVNQNIIKWLGIDVNNWESYDRVYVTTNQSWKDWKINLINTNR